MALCFFHVLGDTVAKNAETTDFNQNIPLPGKDNSSYCV